MGFGSRQVLYERFFASDPLTRARAMAAVYPKGQVMERVLDFLGKSDERIIFNQNRHPRVQAGVQGEAT